MAIGNQSSNKIVLEVKVAEQGKGLSETDLQNLNDFKENYSKILKVTESEEVLLANGTTIAKEELVGARGEKGETGARGERGEQGVQGAKGADGKSAYQIWLDTGNQGSEQDFINSLGGSGLSESEKQKLLRKDERGEHIELYSEGKWNKALKINYAKKFAYPEEFTFRPFDLLEKEDKTLSPVFKGIWEEFVREKAETMTKYYVSPDKGKDTNDGLTPETALKSFYTALSKGARYIEITSNSGILSTNTDIKDININGLEPLIIVAPDVINSGGLFPLHFRSGEASKIDETSGVWSLSNVNYVIGLFESDQQGEINIDRNSLIPYTKHTSLQDLKENGIFPAYFYDSVEKKLYIKQNKYERLSTSSYIHIQHQLNFNIKGQVPFIYVEGINFHNANNEAGLRVHNTDATQYNTKVYFSRCGFKFNPLGGGLKTINVKEVWTERCTTNNNLTTGFEYFTAEGKEKTKVVEINNLSKLQQTASKIINGNAILRINSNYQNGLTDINILDSGENLKSLNIDVAVSSDYNGELPEFKISGNDAKMWIYYQNWANFYKISADTDTSTSAKMYSNMADNEMGINNLSGEIEQVPMLFDREFKSKELVTVNDVHLRVVGDMIEYSYDNIHWDILFPIKLLAGQIHRKPLKRPIFKKKDGNVFYRLEGSQKWTILCKIEDLIAKEHGVVISPSDVIGDRLNYYKVLFAVNHKVLVLAGKYEFEASNAFGVMPKSGSFIHFSRGAHWKMKPTIDDTYSLLWFGDFVSNDVVVEGGYFEGDKWQHGYGRASNQIFDEWGHGICFDGARNIIIRDIKLSRFSGDGVLISNLYNSRFYNGEIEDCRREGIFVGSCNDVEIHNYKIRNTSSPAEGFKKPDNLEPNLSTSDYRSLSFGINCEPDYADRHIDGFRLYNCVFENNEGYRPIGLSVASHNSATPPWYRNGKSMNLIMKVEAHYCEFHKDTLYSSADTDNSVGYFRIIKPRFYNTKLAAIYFGNHVSANFSTQIDNPKMYDCVTKRITQPTHTEAPLMAPIAFNISDAVNGSTGSSVKLNTGHRNIQIINPEYYAKDNASLKEQAISFNQNVTKLSDMENVEIINARFIGYKDVIKTFDTNSISPKHSSFKLTYHSDCEFVKKTGDLIVDNTLKNTYIDKSDAGSITFKDNIPVTNLEYYAKNSSTGEVKLKFESATDIEGLAYGVQEFALARGKRLKMRKIAANRWEYLEGTV